MRIVKIITGLGIGGAENMLTDISIELKKRGHEILVVYLLAKDWFVPQLTEQGITVILIDRKQHSIWSVIRQLRKIIRSFDADIVHTHLPYADTVGRSACLFDCRAKIFTTIHNMDRWKLSKRLRYRLLRLYNRLTVNLWRRNHLIAVSEATRQFCMSMEKIRPDKIVTLRNFVNTDLSKKHHRGVKRSELGYREEDFLLINVGRLTGQKSQIDILHAAWQLKQAGYRNIKFLIIGNGEEYENLMQYIRQHELQEMVRLEAEKWNVYDYFDISDMFLLTSVYEGFSIALQEALLNGLPVLASDIPANREAIVHGSTGLLYPMGDIDALCRYITDCKNGIFDIGTMARHIREESSFHTKETYADKLLGLYHKAL